MSEVTDEELQRRLEWADVAFGDEVRAKLSELFNRDKNDRGSVTEARLDEIMSDVLKIVYHDSYEAGRLSGHAPFTSE